MKQDKLGRLIGSLNSNEKAYFKRWLPSSEKETKTLQIFQAIDKTPSISNKELLLSLKGEFTSKKLGTLKTHLHEKLLLSLRDYHRVSNRTIGVNSKIDGIKVLQAKGLFDDALIECQRLLKKCEEIEMFPEILRVVESMEAIYVGLGYNPTKMDKTWSELYQKKESVSRNLVEISQMRAMERELIQLNSRLGTSEPQDSDLTLITRLQGRISNFTLNENSCFDVKFRYYQTQATVSRILLKHDQERQWFNQVLSLLDENPIITSTYYQGFYAVAIHNYINACILSKTWEPIPNLLERLKNEPPINESISFRNFYFLAYDTLVFRSSIEDYKTGYRDWKSFQKALLDYPTLWQDGDIRLHLQAAVVSFWNRKHKEALSIIRGLKSRVEDADEFPLLRLANVLEIVCNYELGDLDHTEHLIKSMKRRLEEADLTKTVEYLSIEGISEILKSSVETGRAWKNLSNKVQSLCKSTNESHKLLTFNIIKYAEQKQEKSRLK